MFGAEIRQYAHGARTRVLDQRPGNDLERLGHCLVRPLLYALDALGLFAEPDGDGHLGRAAAGGEARVEHDVARHAHGILQVALDLVQDVLGGAAEQDRAGLGVRALRQEGKVFITNLLNLKEAALGPDVGLLQVFYAVDDGGARRSCDSVVVCLAYATERCDVGLHQVMLREICLSC